MPVRISRSGFRAIQKIATMQVSSGFIGGIPVYNAFRAHYLAISLLNEAGLPI